MLGLRPRPLVVFGKRSSGEPSCERLNGWFFEPDKEMVELSDFDHQRKAFNEAMSLLEELVPFQLLVSEEGERESVAMAFTNDVGNTYRATDQRLVVHVSSFVLGVGRVADGGGCRIN